ncbi:MAG TPA: hypothetical protein VFA83_16500 [Acidimicrobiales bacterium]|nr:hypothetical protein [Acidimicrobiales bacterium]
MNARAIGLATVCFIGVVTFSANPAVATTRPVYRFYSIVTAPGPGGGPNIRTFGARSLSFTVPGFGTRSGAFVAAGDLNGDGVDEIVVGSGPGVTAQVKVFNADGTPTGVSFVPYPGFTGGVHVAVGQVLPGGGTQIVTGAGSGGGPHVRVFSPDGTPMGGGFFAYDARFRGGVTIATGHIRNNATEEIVTGPGPGGSDDVRIYDGLGQQLDRSGALYVEPGWLGGVNVAVGDVDGDSHPDVVTGAGPGGGPHVRALTFQPAMSLGGGFFAYSDAFHGGVSVGTLHDQSAGRDDIVVGPGAGGGPNVKVFDLDGRLLNSFFAYDDRFTGGVQVAGAQLDAPRAG